MAGFFLQPKSSNLESETGQKLVRTIQPSNEGFEAEYDSKTGVARHNKDPERREAHPGDVLPSGNRSGGISSSGVRGWRGSVSKTVPSGFGKGTRSGR